MALIRKYNTGGSFADYVKERLAKGELSLTTKSWDPVQEALTTFDPNKSYEGETKKNYWGQDVADNPKSAYVYLANLYKDYQQASPRKINLTPEGGWGPNERSIGTLLEHITKRDYAGNEDYAIRQIARMTDNNQVKKYIVEKSKELADDYLSKAYQNPTDSWGNLEDIKTTRDILASINADTDISEEDWEKVSAFTDKLGWRVNDFLISDETLEQRRVDAENKQKEQERADLFNYYNERGVTDENIQSQLYQGGYTKPADQLHENIRNYLTQKGYNAFTNEAGNDYRVFKGNALATEGMGLVTEDPFSEDYGKYFTINNGILSLTNTVPEGFQLPTWEDEGNRWKGLLSDDPNFKDYIIRGYSRDNFQNKYDRDKLGRRDYTGQLVFSTVDGNSFTVNRKEDGKYYKEDGTLFEVPKLTGFTGDQGEVIRNIDEEYLNNPKSALYGIKSKKSYSTVQDLERDLFTIENDIKQARATGKLQTNKKQLKKIAESISYYLKYDPNNFNKADELAKKLQMLYNEQANPEDPNSAYLLNFKQGGVLKAQSGTSFAAIADRGGRTKGSKQPSENTTATPSSGKSVTVQDVSNAWRNASGLKKASTIASAVSMVPILGVAGGAASTVFDAIDGSRDGWDRKDTMNLIGNLGFTALAGVGLGGAKVGKLLGTAGKAVKAAKGVGKMADSTADVAKLVNKADKALKVTNQAQKAGKLTGKAGDVADSARKVFDKASEAQKILQGADNAKDLAKAKKSAESILKGISTKDLEIVEGLSKVKTKWVGQHTEGIVEGAKTAGRFLRDKAPVVGKAAKIGLVGQTAISGASGAADLIGNMAQSEGNIFQKIGRGFGDTDLNSIRKVAQLGAISRIGYLNKRNSNAFLRNTEEIVGKDAVNAIKVGDKTYNLSKSFKGKNSTWSSLFRRVDNSKLSKGQLNTLEKELKESLKDSDVKVIMDTIKKEGIGAVKNVSTAAEGVRRVLKEGPGIGFKNIRDYNRTKEMIERGSVQRGSFKSMYNKATKKSYTPKDINDEKAAIAKANAKALKKASSDLGKRGSTARAAANKELDLQKLFKENKTVEAAVKKFYGKDVKVENLGKKVKPSQFNKKREKGGLYQVLRDLNMPKNKQGGILKFQNSGIIPSINKGLSLPEWLKSPIKLTYNSLKDSNADKIRFTSPTVSKGMSDFATKFPTISKIFNTPEQSYQGSQIPQTAQGAPGELLIDDYKVLPYEAKPYRNINPLLESAKFAFVNKKNQENLALQLKAATQIPKLNTAERTHLRTSNVYSNIADRQANEVSGEGRRLAGTIADIDKALNVRLEGAKQAAGIRATGAYKDIENNQAIRDKQMGIDANTNAYNRNVMDKQSALSAEAMKNVYAIQSMGKTMEANAGQNFLLAYGRNKESEPYRKAMWEYQQASMDPNLEHSYRYNTYLNTTAKEKARKEYDDFYANLEKTSPEYLNKPTFENSPMYKAWKDKYDSFQSILNGTMSRYNILGRTVQNYMYTPSMQKGGRIPLSERIALENVKYNHKRLLKENELFYKQIMENNRLVQKALSKVFK